jgi:3-oxoacyl-[acyl-carrier protein] reductase
MESLSGRKAIVTGANQGIGAAIAVALAAAGADVYVCYLRQSLDSAWYQGSAPDAYRAARAQDAEAVLQGIEERGGHAVAGEHDLADPDVIPLVFDEACAAFGHVDILVHSANALVQDTFGPARADDVGRDVVPLTAATFDRSFAVGAKATALLIAEFARRHLAREATWGRILGMTTGGSPGFPSHVSYGAGKYALESIVHAAAWELGHHGVTANSLCPPITDTGYISDEMREAARVYGPIGHVGTPEDVADLAVFLCSDRARFISGQRLLMW